MGKSKNAKQKQKQSQSQTVVVNVGTQKRRKKSASSQQMSQLNPRATTVIPSYLGLQTANNAQLLNSLQTSLTQLYNQQNKQKQLFTAPPLPETLGFQSTNLLPPPTPQAQQIVAPPPTNTLPPETPDFTQQAPTAAPKSTKSRSNMFVRFMGRESPSNPLGSQPLPPPDPLVTLSNKDKKDIPGLKYTNKGTIDRRTKEYRRLSQEEKEDLDYEETMNKPPVKARAVAITDSNDPLLEAKVTLARKVKKSGGSDSAATKLVMADDADEESSNYTTRDVPSIVSSNKIYGHTDMKPQSGYQHNPTIWKFKGMNTKVFPEASAPDAETDTDYGNDITTDITV